MTLRFGLIGCGGIVQQSHLPALQTMLDLVEIVALADPVVENRSQVAEHVPNAQQYDDYRDMLETANLDVVSIATPHHLHAEHIMKSSEGGVAIICEKPMATRLEEAEEILEAVNRAGVLLSVVHNYLFMPAMQDALTRLKTGELGQPQFGRAQSLYNKRDDLQATEWRHRPETGGGAINDTAYHEFYLNEALVGSPVKYIEARVQSKYFPFEVDDLVLVLMEHENGAVSTLSTGWWVPEPEVSAFCEVHTKVGSLRVRQRGRSLQQFLRTDRQWEEIDVPGLTSLSPDELRWSGHAGYFKATFTALVNGTPLPVTSQQAYHNLALIDSARQASTQRRAIEIVRKEFA